MPIIGGDIKDSVEKYKESEEYLERKQKEARDEIERRGGLLGTIWGAIMDFFAAYFANVWSGFRASFGGLFGRMENFFTRFDFPLQVERDPDWWKPMLRQFGFDDNDIAAVESLLPDSRAANATLPILIFTVTLMQIIGNVSSAASGSAYKRLMSKFTPGTPTIGEVLRASFIAPELHEEVMRIARENGLSDADIKMLMVANYALEDPDLIRDIYFREGKSEAWLENRLREHGFTDERIEEIKSSLPVIPSIQDLVYFMGREAFEPDMINRYGLDELYPAELTEWAAKQGLSEFWAKKYWYAHWTHPELRTVFELYHRDQITEGDMWNYFGLVEIPPFWREKLTNISYNVITRVDARRMWQLGVIKEEKQLFDLYRHMGYSPDDARLMTEWTKVYTTEQDRDVTRSDIEQAYIDRDLTASEAAEMLVKIGYPSDYADFIVYRVEMRIQRDVREEKLGLIKDRYVARLIDEAEARKQTINLGFTPGRVNELIDKWNFARWQAVKLPSKTDMDKFFRNDIVDRSTYTDMMRQLGYTDTHIGWYLELLEKGGSA